MLRLSRLGASAAVLVCCALRLSATPPLTTIQDTLYLANGTPLSGEVIITWPSFVAVDGSKIAAQSLTVPVTNGYFQTALVPTVGAATYVTYLVRINSAGMNESTETWSVPQTTATLTIEDVSVTQTGGTTTTGSPSPSSAPVEITDVVGLSAALGMRPLIGIGFADSRAAVIDSSGAIDGAAGNPSDCVHVDGTSGSCGGGIGAGTFVDNETPAGDVDGVNTQFTLNEAPVPASSLALFRNGILQAAGPDFTLANTVVSFTAGSTPQPGDRLLATYRTAAVTGIGFVDAETPAGTMDGSNLTFTLAEMPIPASSVALYLNGVRQTAGVDYTFSGQTISFLSGLAPEPGDVLLCSYRVAE